MKKKIAIIGASYLQEPLIQKAKAKGLETHVFAWECGDIGEKSADYFYPISIVEKEEIAEKCREIGISGVCSIASDLAAITVNYVASQLGLIGNDMQCVNVSTNKHNMRRCFEKNNDPSPRSIIVEKIDDLVGVHLDFPIIVKPTDRSGSRGITKVNAYEDISEAIARAVGQSFEKKALVEEYAEGKEYSVEYVSWQGKHKFLAVTQKYTTGAPGFIETGHLEQAQIDDNTSLKIKKVVEHALNSLGIKFGASHSEIKISEEGSIKIIEIGGRMGGDCIGSSLVELSTGYDFLGAVIDISLGIEPQYCFGEKSSAAIRFIFSEKDIDVLNRIKNENPEILVCEDVREITNEKVVDSSTRFGYFIISSQNVNELLKYMPIQCE